MGGKCIKDPISKERFVSTNSKYIEALKKVQYCAKKFRLENKKVQENIDYSIPIRYEERLGNFNDKPITRLVIRLRSRGCGWVEKTGGCTMCGFYDATSMGNNISAEDYISQFNHVIDEIDLNDYPIVGIYNDGNFFNENEIPMNAVEEICRLLNNFKKVKKVVIESRIEYVPFERIQKVKKCLNNKQIEVAFGFESIDNQVINLCINKGFSLNRFGQLYNAFQSNGFSMKPYLLLKPPFLTEQESINDVLSTIDYLSLKGIRYIDLEVTMVQKYTLVHELWKRNLYQPPMLWSIIDIISKYKKKHKDKINLYISPTKYSVEAIDSAKNCIKCDEEVVDYIDQYNKDFKADSINELYCNCKEDEWKHRIQEVNELTIPERILDQLKFCD